MDQEINVTLYALTGEVIISENHSLSGNIPHKITLDPDRHKLQSNLYMLVVIGDEETLTRQMVKTF